MNFLKCIICDGEVDIVGNEYFVNKKIKCKKCNFTNLVSADKEPEILIIRKKLVE